MQSEIEEGIIHLWNLRSNSLINIKEKKREEIKNKIYKKFGNISNFCLKYGLPYQKVRLFLLKKSNISIKNFIKICKFLGYSITKIESCVSLIKYRSTGFSIKDPKLPFNFKTKSGIRIIASILTDGCISKHIVQYSNKNLKLIKTFVSDLENVLGKLNHRIRKDKNDVYTVYLPVIVKYILKILNLKVGAKIKTNPSIPKFISSSKDLISEFLGYVIANDGCVDYVKHTGVRRIRIGTATLHNTVPNFLLGCKKLFESLDINCKIKFKCNKKRENGRVSKIWEIRIVDKRNLEKIYEQIKIPLNYKQDKLNEIITSYRQLGKGELYNKVKNLCKLYSIKKRIITVSILAKELNRNKETIREVINKLEDNDFIFRQNKPSGSIPIYYGVKSD